MVDAAIPTAVAAGLALGLVTFFSPCAYPLLPGYVGFYASQTDGDVTLGGSILRGIVAGAGVLVTLGALLWGGLLLGESLVQRLVYPGVVVGVALVLAGIVVLFGRGPSLTIALPRRRSGIAGFGIFGAGYAVASVGCIVPVFGAFVFGLGEFSPGATVAAVLTYLGSVSGLMVSFTVAAGTGIGLGSEGLDLPMRVIHRVAGVVLVAAGLGQLYVALVVI